MTEMENEWIPREIRRSNLKPKQAAPEQKDDRSTVKAALWGLALGAAFGLLLLTAVAVW